MSEEVAETVAEELMVPEVPSTTDTTEQDLPPVPAPESPVMPPEPISEPVDETSQASPSPEPTEAAVPQESPNAVPDVVVEEPTTAPEKDPVDEVREDANNEATMPAPSGPEVSPHKPQPSGEPEKKPDQSTPPADLPTVSIPEKTPIEKAMELEPEVLIAAAKIVNDARIKDAYKASIKARQNKSAEIRQRLADAASSRPEGTTLSVLAREANVTKHVASNHVAVLVRGGRLKATGYGKARRYY